jgi:hypothetical protein
MRPDHGDAGEGRSDAASRVPELAPLRTKVKLQAVRRGLEKCAARSDFRVIAVSVQNTHIQLIVEAEDKRAMWAG